MILNYQKIELLEKTVFERVIFKPPLKATEIMENEACLIYSINGNSNMYGEDRSQTLDKDESVLMKCGNFINHWQLSQEENPYDVIAIHFYPDVLKLIFENQIPEYLQKPINHNHQLFQKIDRNSILKSYIDSLLVYFENPVLFTHDTTKLKLKELIALLYNMNINGVREILSDLFNPNQVEFKKVIAEHLYHDLSLEEYATLLHLSLSSFKRRFREIYSASPGQYIKNKRLEKAASLLASTSSKIGDICFDCGFGDLSNFTKAFSKKYGMSPSKYQNQQMVWFTNLLTSSTKEQHSCFRIFVLSKF